MKLDDSERMEFYEETRVMRPMSSKNSDNHIKPMFGWSTWSMKYIVFCIVASTHLPLYLDHPKEDEQWSFPPPKGDWICRMHCCSWLFWSMGEDTSRQTGDCLKTGVHLCQVHASWFPRTTATCDLAWSGCPYSSSKEAHFWMAWGAPLQWRAQYWERLMVSQVLALMRAVYLQGMKHATWRCHCWCR